MSPQEAVDAVHQGMVDGVSAVDLMKPCELLLWHAVEIDRSDPDPRTGEALCACATAACLTGEVEVSGKAFYERAAGTCVAIDTGSCRFVHDTSTEQTPHVGSGDAPMVVPLVTGAVIGALVIWLIVRRRRAASPASASSPAPKVDNPYRGSPNPRDEYDDALDEELHKLDRGG